MDERDKQTRLTSVTNQEADIDVTDRQKLYDGFVVLAKILAREIAKKLHNKPKADTIIPNSYSSGPLAEKIALSCSEATEILGLSRATVYNLISQNKIPHIRYGKRILIPQVALMKQINEIRNGEEH